MSTQEEREVKLALVEAKHLIENPEHWIQGRSRMVTKSGDIGYCSYGAVVEAIRVKTTVGRTSKDNLQRKMLGLLNRAAQRVSPLLNATFNAGRIASGIIDLNDGTDHATVMRAFDEAIAEQGQKVMES